MHSISYVGLDVHKATIAVAVADGGRSREVRQGAFANRWRRLKQLFFDLRPARFEEAWQLFDGDPVDAGRSLVAHHRLQCRRARWRASSGPSPVRFSRRQLDNHNALDPRAGGPNQRIVISQALTAGGRATVGNPQDLL